MVRKSPNKPAKRAAASAASRLTLGETPELAAADPAAAGPSLVTGSPARLKSPAKSDATELQRVIDLIQEQLWNAQGELEESRRASEQQQASLAAARADLKRLTEQNVQYTEELQQHESDLQTLQQKYERLVQQQRTDRTQNLDLIDARDKDIEDLHTQLAKSESLVKELRQQAKSSSNIEPVPEETPVAEEYDQSMHKVPRTSDDQELLLSTARYKQAVRQLQKRLQAERSDKFRARAELAKLKGEPVPVFEMDDLTDSPDWTNSLDSTSNLIDSGVLAASPNLDSQDMSAHDLSSHDLSSHDLSSHDLSMNANDTLEGDLVGVPLSDEIDQISPYKVTRHLSREQLETDAMQLGYQLVPVSSTVDHEKEMQSEIRRLMELSQHLNRPQLPVHEYERLHELLNRRYPASPQRSHVLQDLVTSGTITLAESRDRAIAGLSSEDVAKAATALGLAVLPASQFEQLNREVAEGRAPNAAKIAELAAQAGLNVVPTDPTIDELKGISGPDIVVTDRHSYEALEKPGPTSLRLLAKNQGLVVIPETEYEQLSKQPPSVSANRAASTTQAAAISVDEVRQLAKEHNLVVVSPQDYEIMLKRPDFTKMTMQERARYYEVLSEAHNSPTRQSAVRSSPSHSSAMEESLQRLGLVSITQKEYEHLKNSQKLYEPTKSDVIQSAKRFGLATMPSEEYEKVRHIKWSSPKFDVSSRRTPFASPLRSEDTSPTKTTSSTHASQLNEEFRAVPAAYLAELQKFVDTPSRKDVEALAQKLGLAVYSGDVELREKAKALGLATPLSDDEIETKAFALGLIQPPTNAEIITKALTLGLVHPPKDDEVVAKAKTLGLAEPPTDEEVVSKALNLGLVHKSSDEDIITKALSLGLVHPPREDEIVAKAKSLGLSEPLSDTEIVAKAHALGLVDAPKDTEIVTKALSLGLVHAPKDDEIVAKALTLGLVHPLKDDELIAKAKTLGLIDPPSDGDIITRALALGLVHPPRDDEIVAKATNLGLVQPLKKEEILAKAKELGLVDKPSNEDVITTALTLGLVHPLKDDEVVARAKKIGFVEPPTKEHILAKAKEFGLVDQPKDEEITVKALSLGLVHPPKKDEIIAGALSLGLVHPPQNDEIVAKAKNLGLVDAPEDKDIITKALTLGLVHPLQDDEIVAKALQLGLTKPVTDDEILAKAGALGLAKPLDDAEIVAKAKSLGLIDAADAPAITTKALALGLVQPPTNDEILAKAKSLGLVDPLSDKDVCKRALTLGLVQPPTDQEITARAKGLGLAEPLGDAQITAKALTLGLVKPPTDKEIKAKGKQLGLIEAPRKSEVIAKAKEFGLVEQPSDDAIKSRARELGMEDRATEAQSRARAASLGFVDPTNRADIVAHAKQYGMVTDAEVLERAKALGLVVRPTKQEILDAAKQNGLTEKLTDEEIVERGLASGLCWPLTDSEILAAAKRLGLVDPAEQVTRTNSYDADGHTSERPNKSARAALSHRRRATRDLDNDSLKASSWKDESRETTAEARTSVETLRTSPETTEATIDAKATPAAQAEKSAEGSEEPDFALFESRGRSATLPTHSIPPVEPSHASTHTSRSSSPQHASMPRLMSRRFEVSNGRTPRRMAAARIPRSTTTGSLNRYLQTPSMSSASDSEVPLPQFAMNDAVSESSLGVLIEDPEQLVQQLMFGEILYKYYGGMNFEGITGGRHRRFFWYRPNTKRIYWHREKLDFLSPVAKYVTINTVEEVIDRNELPVKLYHRTIIIHGAERDVKITCPNQKRHNIWLAALQYLAQTNGEI